MGPGLRVTVPPKGCNDLLDQARLALGGRLHGTQMPRFETKTAQVRNKLGDRDGLDVVSPSA